MFLFFCFVLFLCVLLQWVARVLVASDCVVCFMGELRELRKLHECIVCVVCVVCVVRRVHRCVTCTHLHEQGELVLAVLHPGHQLQSRGGLARAQPGQGATMLGLWNDLEEGYYWGRGPSS